MSWSKSWGEKKPSIYDFDFNPKPKMTLETNRCFRCSQIHVLIEREKYYMIGGRIYCLGCV